MWFGFFAPAKTFLYLSPMPAEILLIFCTCPDRASAEQIANQLIDEGLAACVNITAPVTSVYRWQGKRETAEEHLLLIKTAKQRYPELERAITAHHPYELPEIVAVPVAQGLQGYLHWVEQCTEQEN